MESDKGKYCYEYPRPAMTSDIVVYGYDGRQLHILLVERGCEPFRGKWALPGGFMRMDETIEECAARELREETGIADAWLRQFGVFSAVGRDPRGRVVTVAFLGLISKTDYRIIAGDDAASAAWFPVDELPPLAFDHDSIIGFSRKRLRELLATEPVVFRLLDSKFSLAELQRLVESLTGENYDRRNFQRRILQSNMLASEGCEEDSPSRPASLYSIREDSGPSEKKRGFGFFKW